MKRELGSPKCLPDSREVARALAESFRCNEVTRQAAVLVGDAFPALLKARYAWLMKFDSVWMVHSHWAPAVPLCGEHWVFIFRV